MADLTTDYISRVKKNVRTMIDKNASDQEIDKYIADKGLSQQQLRGERTVSLGSIIDTRTGAPASVREIVGGAPMQDQLANLKRYYPDAQPYGPDNFVFTDPGTRRPTLYNPEGLDVGDIAEQARTASSMLFGGAGAAAGASGGPVTTALGAGLGTSIGNQLYDIVAQGVRGRIDTRSPAQRITDIGIDVGVGAAGQAVADRIPTVAKNILARGIGIAKRTPEQLRNTYIRLGVRPLAGAVSGSRPIQVIEDNLSNTLVGRRIIDATDEAMTGLRDAANRVAERFGPILDPEQAGATIRTGIRGSIRRFQDRSSQLYGELRARSGGGFIPGDALAPMSNTVNTLERIIGRFSETPNLQGRFVGSEMSLLRDVLGDLANVAEQRGVDIAESGLPFDTLLSLRSLIGKSLTNTADEVGGLSLAQRRQLYGALTADIRQIAAEHGPRAIAAFNRANRYYRFNIDRNVKPLLRVLNTETPEQAYKLAVDSGKAGGTKLRRLRRNLRPEEWDAVAGTVLSRLGKATPGAQNALDDAFSPATFLTNWSRLTPGAKAALFTGSRYRGLSPALDDLVSVAASLKDAAARRNASGTARALSMYAVLGGAGVGALDAIDGDLGTLGKLGVGAVVMPHVAARLLTNRDFVRWLAKSAEDAVRAPNSITASLTRLAGIAKVAPEIREEVYQYLEALRAPPSPQNGPPPRRAPQSIPSTLSLP